MALKKKKDQLITVDETDLTIRISRLRNKFAAAAFIDEYGIEWAEVAIDPTNDTHWTHDAYLECYGSGKDN